MYELKFAKPTVPYSMSWYAHCPITGEAPRICRVFVSYALNIWDEHMDSKVTPPATDPRFPDSFVLKIDKEPHEGWHECKLIEGPMDDTDEYFIMSEWFNKLDCGSDWKDPELPFYVQAVYGSLARSIFQYLGGNYCPFWVIIE